MGRHNVWLWIAVLAMVLGAALNAFKTMSADTDLWGHLRFGEAHWESGQLERTDSYSFTSGEIWINHEWLSELIFFASYNAGGDLGLLVLKLMLGSGDLRWLWAGATGAAIATLLNPYGIELLKFFSDRFPCRGLSVNGPRCRWLEPIDCGCIRKT
jgi:hypothetical protein